MSPEVKKRVEKAVAQFKLSAETYSKQRQREESYLRFQVPELQWEDEIRDYRSSQFGNQGVPMPPDPTLSISMLDEPIQLELNRQRAASLEPKIHALSEDATDDTALVLQELNRHIDVDPDSRAANARSWGMDRSTKAGLGWYYIDKVVDPDGGHPFDQKLLVKRLLYQDGIFPDPTAQMADWSDGMFLHDIVDVPWDSYTLGKYAKSKLAEFSESDFKAMGPADADWIVNVADKERRAIRISNYWRVEILTRRYVLLNDGSVEFDDEIPDGKSIATDDDVQRLQYEGLRERDVEERHVYKSVMNGIEELEPEVEWDGKYIPYIPCIGIELQPFESERRWVGMIAGAMDAQRLVNYSASQAVKIAALEPQAPWQAEEGVLPEPLKSAYVQGNTRKFPVLTYAATNAAGMRSTAPSRVQIDTARLGPSMELLTMGKDFVQAATFTYGPSRGEQTPAHRSGTAIQALQGQTAQGNSHFLDNEANISLPLEMKIKLDLIPHVYDRPGRVLQVITGEGKTRQVMLNQPFTMQGNRPVPFQPLTPDAPLPDGVKHFNLNKGRYGVSVTIGKSNDSRVQEGSDAVGRIMEADPQLLPILGPAWAKFQDFPGAHAVQLALEKWQAHVAPWMSDHAQQNAAAQIPQLQQQVQHLTVAAQQMKQQLDTDAVKYEWDAKTKIALKDLDAKTTIQIQQMKDATQIEVARINAAKEGMIAEREAAEERLATGLKIQAEAAKQALDHGHVANQAELDRQHELRTTGLEHGAAIAQSAQDHGEALAQGEQANQAALDQADAQRQAAEAAQPAPTATGDANGS